MDGITIYDESRKHTPIRGVLFDMDGTVLDTERIYSRFWVVAANALGYPMTHEHALQLRSVNAKLGQQRIEQFFGPGASYSAIRTKRIELMEEYIARHGVQAKPGIRELLADLRSRGIRTSIATASPMERALRYLGSVGLAESFDQICCTYDVPNGKPAPDVYLYAAKQLGLAPETCLALEDSPTGVESAWRAGCLSVMVPDQDQPSDATKALLFAKADRLDQVIGLLEWMNV